MFAAGLTLGREEYIAVARQTADFLAETSFCDGHFSFVGTQGWYERGKTCATFDQQPVEAAMVLMLQGAYEATRDARYLGLHGTAFDWFLGVNDLGCPLYDPHTKGCADGLMSSAVNGNQGRKAWSVTC
ncbi:MAG: hypothetical protein MUC88_15525 [Planctomycetes bacterium]|nr:hypothetical protein [Planctomycetota bacterium]